MNAGDHFAGKRVLVVGLGESGFAAARVLLDLNAKVRVTEAGSSPAVLERAAALAERGAEVETGGHDLDRLDADLAVVSPGIPPTAHVVEALRRVGIEVIGEVELAFELAHCEFIAITGTNGKTTTTSLVAAMLSEAGIDCVAAGNIGLPLVDAVMTVPPGGVIAAEVSSFQLATTRRFHPKIAVILNVAQDHTDWHGSQSGYIAAKARIVVNQQPGDVCLPNADDPFAMEIAQRGQAKVVPFSARRVPEGGIGVSGGELLWNGQSVIAVDEVPLAGRAGIEDAGAAAGAALELGVDRRAVARAIKGFRPLPHRLELVAEVGGVSYIDDSKATNPHATLAAVAGLRDVVLIAGGRSKGIDLTPLLGAVPPVRAVIALGEAAPALQDIFRGVVPVEVAASMTDAVARAGARAVSGGSVLLSPGCASLDMYKSYAERGEDFARAVAESVQLTSPEGRDGNT